MKVLNLRCSNGHGFEGWFASEEDYQSQNGRGLVECPLCGDRMISRLPSAPRLNLSGARAPDAAPAAPQAAEAAAVQARWLQALRQVIASTEDVGARFAEEARRIHYGEAERRGIRGQASAEDAKALVEEGIEVAVLPMPDALKEPLQ
ncbi:MAG: DUF1178 family protein [Pseudomonadota bacterium]